ncbi:hypothetical protein NliqN6_5964 [Naganishia liquefaciens]|uniref:Major facilitator superfamily (MFS) profile domain-containing protein n=1 Tax=Naganishia liquefaciens TaxID=104408 RepID=A0A8H3YIW0_9TREE|nr:hypothetical protein NliqN6_5964 [Naganishia liquefaciens]
MNSHTLASDHDTAPVVVPAIDVATFGGFDGQSTAQMLAAAQEADRADHELTIRQALRKYKVAVFWAMFLSCALVMEGYDVVVIGSFYGQPQFIDRFGSVGSDGKMAIQAKWQTSLSNSSVCGQLIGLAINGYAQDRFGCRPTYITGMIWMTAVIFLPVFAHSIDMLIAGQVLCGTAWGMFQTLSTTYACEVVPTCLRPFVTGWVCMCWGAGIVLSSGVVRAVVNLEGNLAWRLPFMLQWVWPLPLALGAYFAPESPWNAVRRGQYAQARASLLRLRAHGDHEEQAVDNTMAYMVHVTRIEQAETAGAGYLECFKGTNARRTEINCVVWAAQILCGNAILGYAVVFLQKAGFGVTASFNLNLITNCQYIVGGVACWFLMARFGRATLYMAGLVGMLVCLIITGGLGCLDSDAGSIGVGVLLVIQTLINMTTIGPVCYPIVAETPSGRLRAKTITIGRIVYNITGIVSNSITPRMISSTSWNWGAKAAFFYAGTNALCLAWCWFRLPETKDRTFGEIDLLFENKVPARKFKSTKVDQFATDRVVGAEVQDAFDLEKKGSIVHEEHV